MSKLTACYRGNVNSWECDQMGHMNVQFYMARGSEAFGHFQNALGLSPPVIRESKKGLRFKSLRIQFKAEVHAGSILHGLCGMREVVGDILHGFIHLYDTAYNRLSAVFEFSAVYTDFVSNEALPLPSSLRDTAEALCDEHPDIYLPAPFSGTLMPCSSLDHMFESSRSSVNTWECDNFNHIEMRHIVGYFSDAATHIIGAIGLTRAEIRRRNLGSAALDYYTEFHAPIKMSTPIVLKSGLISAERKIFRFGHNLVDLDSGNIAVTTTVVGCYFDMSLRKSVALPDEFTNYPKEKWLSAQL
ncbi:thioesterase family protein [uncultured Sneathiella sp.]|jgi:acyl-CoA thioester hydrolase|uniref:acyl-CoA thioesterase n=1 Tax=uncultured Sneathiella sp. TaxID=879315 RepID=UPI0030D7D179|tara:strand:- start:21237 stop:22139 length:903 start_codon:yes stop_codon:yes gene_type:complete